MSKLKGQLISSWSQVFLSSSKAAVSNAKCKPQVIRIVVNKDFKQNFIAIHHETKTVLNTLHGRW